MKQWYTAKELAGMPGLPGTIKNVLALGNKQRWKWRKRQGRGGGREFALNSLPANVRVYLAFKTANTEPIFDSSGLPIHPEAYDYFLSALLNDTGKGVRVCYRQLVAEAVKGGWKIPDLAALLQGVREKLATPVSAEHMRAL